MESGAEFYPWNRDLRFQRVGWRVLEGLNKTAVWSVVVEHTLCMTCNTFWRRRLARANNTCLLTEGEFVRPDRGESWYSSISCFLIDSGTTTCVWGNAFFCWKWEGPLYTTLHPLWNRVLFPSPSLDKDLYFLLLTLLLSYRRGCHYIRDPFLVP